MMMTTKQSKYYEMGKTLSAEYSGNMARAMWDMDQDTLDYIAYNDLICSFFTAGFEGDEPEYVEAVRYGELPESGRSVNWATRGAEKGVSCIRIIRKADDETAQSIYDVTLGLRGVAKYVVSGWYFGDRGSDGEPILKGAKIVREAARLAG